MDIYERLTKIQNELKAPKKENNSFGGYKYRTAESIYKAVKPILDEHNCSLRLDDELIQIGDRYYIKSSAILVSYNPEDGRDLNTIKTTAFAREALSKKGMDDSQVTGSASTYARKYALMALFLIDNTDDDPDSEEYQKKIKKNTAKEEKKVEEDPERIAAYEDYKGLCKANGLSAAAVARDLKLSSKSTADEFRVAIEGLTQLIETNQDLSKWRAK